MFLILLFRFSELLLKGSSSTAKEGAVIIDSSLDLLVKRLLKFYRVHCYGNPNPEPFLCIREDPGVVDRPAGLFHIEHHNDDCLGAFLYCTNGISTEDVVPRWVSYQHTMDESSFGTKFMEEKIGAQLLDIIDSETSDGETIAKEFVNFLTPAIVEPYYKTSLMKEHEEFCKSNRRIAEAGDLTLLSLFVVQRIPSFEVERASSEPKPRCVLFIGITEQSLPFEHDFAIFPWYLLAVIKEHNLTNLKREERITVEQNLKGLHNKSMRYLKSKLNS